MNSNGALEAQGFVLLIENADAAEMRRMEGRETGLNFFTSHSSEKTIQVLQKNGAIDPAAQDRK